MKRAALILLMIIALTGCERPQVESTPEEALMTQMFTTLSVAMAYDETCNNSQYINAGNANLTGNLNLLASRLYTAVYNNRPRLDRKEVEKRVKYQGQYALSRAREVFDRRGCSSIDAKPFATALQVYTSTPPEAVASLIDAQMQKEKITPARKRR
jgi:hypothetical protein